MNPALTMDFKVDKQNRQIHVNREFAAPLELVWSAWTEAEILDQWWAPKPWQTYTKEMDFRVGGHWLYAMRSPEGEEHWCRADYLEVEAPHHFRGLDAFCDSEGKVSNELPRTEWDVRFVAQGDHTLVTILNRYENLEDLEKIIEMGFKEGFTMGLQNLDQWLSAKFRLRQENKTSSKARVSTYLNFNGNTEEVFLWYKEVFGGEFTGRGLQRFGDVDFGPEGPPLTDELKDLIIHVELTIMGGHILMGTDAPESMGFHMKSGNNMHINLEPETREEADRLFRTLSEGGEVEMPLQEMFWGGYYAGFQDKFGINWMINYQPPA